MKPPLKIHSLTARAVAVPMKRPLATSTGALSVAPLLLIDLQTDAGIVGRAYLFGLMQQNLKPLAALVELMGEMVKGDPLAAFRARGEAAQAPHAARRAQHRAVRHVGHRHGGLGRARAGARAAARAAARRRAAPGARLQLQGPGHHAAKALAREAGELVAEGFSAVKLRLGRPEAADDLAALRAVREGHRPGHHPDGGFQPGAHGGARRSSAAA